MGEISLMSASNVGKSVMSNFRIRGGSDLDKPVPTAKQVSPSKEEEQPCHPASSKACRIGRPNSPKKLAQSTPMSPIPEAPVTRTVLSRYGGVIPDGDGGRNGAESSACAEFQLYN